MLIFPSPESNKSTATSRSGMKGSFSLIEDDGTSNDHSLKGVYTELNITFKVEPSSASSSEKVEVDYQVIRGSYKLPYDKMEFVLPKGDERELVAAEGKELISLGGGRWGLKVVV